MKRLMSFILVVLLITIMSAFPGCEPVAPEAEPSSLIPTSNSTFDIGRSNLQWNKIYCQSYYVMANLLTIPTSYNLTGTTDAQTLTNKTLTSPTITTPTVTGTGSIIVSSVNATNVGTVSGSLTITGSTIASPTLTGTMVNPNVAMGNDNITGTSAIVTHGLSGTPTIILLTPAGSVSDNTTFYWSTANGTNFTINSITSISNVAVSWVAWIASE